VCVLLSCLWLLAHIVSLTSNLYLYEFDVICNRGMGAGLAGRFNKVQSKYIYIYVCVCVPLLSLTTRSYVYVFDSIYNRGLGTGLAGRFNKVQEGEREREPSFCGSLGVTPKCICVSLSFFDRSHF